MTLEQALRLTNRNMIVFDLLLGSAAIAAPAATLKVLGHEEPSPDAKHLFRRCGPIWLTFAAAHLVAERRGSAADWQSLAWLRGTARKLYHCPGCHGEVPVGEDHTIVQFVRRLGGTDHHHWHRRCAEEILVPELGGLKKVPASESSQSRLEARGRRPAGRRDRRR